MVTLALISGGSKVQGHPLLQEQGQPRLPSSPSEKEYYFDKNILTHRHFLRHIHNERGEELQGCCARTESFIQSEILG